MNNSRFILMIESCEISKKLILFWPNYVQFDKKPTPEGWAKFVFPKGYLSEKAIDKAQLLMKAQICKEDGSLDAEVEKYLQSEVFSILAKNVKNGIKK